MIPNGLQTGFSRCQGGDVFASIGCFRLLAISGLHLARWQKSLQATRKAAKELHLLLCQAASFRAPRGDELHYGLV